MANQSFDSPVKYLSQSAISLIGSIESLRNSSGAHQDSSPIEVQKFDIFKSTLLAQINHLFLYLRGKQLPRLVFRILFSSLLLLCLPMVTLHFIFKDYQNNQASNMIEQADELIENSEDIQDKLAAIEILQQIPTSTRYYQTAQEKVYIYSRDILLEAEVFLSERRLSVEEVNYWEAIYILNQVPENTPAYLKAK